MPKRTNYNNWTPAMDNQLRELFPVNASQKVADIMGISLSSVNMRAHFLGLKKDIKHIAHVREYTVLNLGNGAQYRFSKGHEPFNKGKKMRPATRRKIQSTFFKKGQKPHNTKWDGYERVNADGYTEVRIADRVFIGKHRLLWEQHHGQVPKGMCVIFADGDKTNFNLENLVCVSRGELVTLNKNKKYGPEIAETALLLSKIKNHLKTN